MSLPVILDTDPGIDDAVAIITLCRYKRNDVKLIVSSYGNISIDKTTNNALTMCELLDWDVPVLKGTSLPDNENYIPAAHIHGEDGLGGQSFATHSRKAIEGDYLKILYDTIMEYNLVDYITIGPMTNLALLIKRFPDVIGHINLVVTMGGGFAKGNITPDAEFNIYCDPQSADFVFKNINKLVLVPLNTTLTVWFNPEEIEKIAENKTHLSDVMAKILTVNYHSCLKYGEPGSVMHDATAICYYLFPELFNTKTCGVSVNIKDKPGKTEICAGENILVTTECENKRILEIIANSIQ